MSQLQKTENIEENPTNISENQAQQEQINNPVIEQPSKNVVQEHSDTTDDHIQSSKRM